MSGLALVIGLVLMPLLIWVIGNRILGPYTHGADTHAGPLALLSDFYVGLAHWSFPFWLVALGPMVILLFVRIVLAMLRQASGSPAKPRPRD